MTIKQWGYTQFNGPWLRIPALPGVCGFQVTSTREISPRLTGPAPPQAAATSSSGDHSHGKHGLVLNPPPVTCTSLKHESHSTHTQDREAHSTDETSLVQAVCRSSHGLRLGQVELLQHKIPEGVERMVYSQIFVRKTRARGIRQRP